MTESTNSVEQFIAWTRELKGGMILYRGLADADWEVESSAYRRMTKLEDVSSELLPAATFQNYIDHLLDEASLQGLRERQDRSLSDLELLAELQHYGAATCLIDFTTSAAIALYFACREEKDRAGKVVALATDDIFRFSTVGYEDLKKPITEFLNQNRLWKWEPSGLNNRIVARQSVFVFGEGRIGKSIYEDFTIGAVNKKDIIETLDKSFGVNEQRLFNDLAGFALINAHNQPYDGLPAEDYYYLSIALHQRGEHKQAVDSYSRAIELAPKRAEFYNSRGATMSILKDYQRAIADFDKAIELDPQHALAFNNRGAAKKASNDLQGAIDDYNRAIVLNSQDAVIYTNRGVAKRELGVLQEAIADYDKAIELNPRAADAYNYRGAAKGDSGDFQGAISDCTKAVDLNPKFAEAYYIRGAAKNMLRNHKGAIADCEKAIRLNPSCAEAYYHRGMARHASGDKQQAVADFNKAIELKPNYAQAYNSRGVEKCYSGNHQGGIADFNKAIELKPAFAIAYYNRGKARRALGDAAGAENDFAKKEEIDASLRPPGS